MEKEAQKVKDSSDQSEKVQHGCQCGKSYLSFAAIYLHFRNKHNIKLSTKVTESRRKQYFQKGFRKLTYSCGNQIIFDQKSYDIKSGTAQKNKHQHQYQFVEDIKSLTDPLSQINECFDCYLETEDRAPKWIYRMLKQFFEEQYSKGQELERADIPLFLNRLMLDYAVQYNRSVRPESSTWRRMCEELSRFCSWMRAHGLTELVVIYNQEKEGKDI